MISNPIIRIRIVLSFVCLIALIIFAKLYWVQIVKGSEYREKAENQYTKPVQSVFERGSIFFESKDNTKIAAATMKEGYTLAINPKLIKDANSVYDALSTYIDLDKKEFLAKAEKKDDPYEEIVRKLDKKIGESIYNMKLPGVVVSKENWRVYPGNNMGAHEIGILGLDSKNNLAGRYGLERYFEDILSRNSVSFTTNFFAEVFSDIKNTVFSSDDKKGDIVTTIEPTVLNFLEKILKETQGKWNSDSIGGIIMDPNTGEIFALSSRPTFNPNDLKDIKDPKIFSNPLVEDVYEMGSIIKPLTMAVGLDTHAINANSTYDDTGFMELNKKKISNFDGRARGVIPVQEVLSQSLNIGAATIALKSGHDEFSKYFKNLGLGEKTGIEQPNEQSGIIKNLDSARDIEIATASYGQGIAMTPMETVRALATLANGGRLITPHLIKKIEHIDGTVEDIKYIDNNSIFDENTTDDVTKMLVKVVDTALKKGQAKMEHYSIAAKTGTAQIADHKNGGYYDDRYLHSFFGYFPAYKPRFIVFLYHVYPKDVQFASETLTDPFMQIAKFLINYYEIAPDR